MAEPVVIATWPFGRTAVQVAYAALQRKAAALDAALAGAQAVEDDPAVNSVGYGGLANAIGTVALDACVMDGKTLACGAVAGVENIRHVAALAKRVMDKTPHVFLVGHGAQQFALQQGFALEPLSTPASVAEWEQKRPKPGQAAPAPPMPPPAPANECTPPHDTVTVLALDAAGNLGGVCTTSGLPFKLPGRVGDSPIIGAGLYVDNTAGAAGATGVGEEIIRISASTLIVESLRAGKSPQAACELAAARVHTVAMRRGMHAATVAFIALDPQGRVGAACTPRTNFQYAVARADKVELFQAKVIEAQ
jgi:isoaspartyl peptidase/L-asparaginase-like protein (Ntn-hydrolase superfamily)